MNKEEQQMKVITEQDRRIVFNHERTANAGRHFRATSRTPTVLEAVLDERARQMTLKAEGRFDWHCADLQTKGRPIAPAEKLAVLAEEFGEVSREVCEGLTRPINTEALEKELIQVAAVAVAWAEALQLEREWAAKGLIP